MFLLLILNIISIFVCFYIAKYCNTQSYYWAFMGALVGPLAILFAFLSKLELKNQ
jgi:hypothetical protein